MIKVKSKITIKFCKFCWKHVTIINITITMKLRTMNGKDQIMVEIDFVLWSV